jgi:xanthine dehydrogenase accessory factor
MAVFADEVMGTIGGGHLEWQAIAQARQLLAQWDADPAALREHIQRYALGPSLGQCCGGALELHFAWFDARDAQRLRALMPEPSQCVALFGAGHVGHALVRILRSLPYRVIWVDSRDAVFPVEEQIGVQCEHSDPVQAGGTAAAAVAGAHHELQPCRRPGGGGAMPAAPARARRSAFVG